MKHVTLEKCTAGELVYVSKQEFIPKAQPLKQYI